MTATLSIGTLLLFIVFDRPLTPALLSVIPWFGVANLGAGGRGITPNGPPQAFASTVSMLVNVGGAQFGPDRIDYTPPPADLLGVTGTPVAPFAGFPINVVP